MGLEIERKFIVTSLIALEEATTKSRIRQGYLNLDIDRTVRVRAVNDTACWLTVTGRNTGATRQEFEYRIPEQDGWDMLEMCVDRYIDKTRYDIPLRDFVVKVDIFDGYNDGLIIAEIEFEEGSEMATMPEEEFRQFLPDWIGAEVTDDTRYYNSSLLTNPYKDWRE